MNYVAIAIKMIPQCDRSYNLLEIDEIQLSNNSWYKKAAIHDYVKAHPGSIKVGNVYGPNIIPAISIAGEKYVKSSPNNSQIDNLLNLPRK
jgi:hypothetical protein